LKYDNGGLREVFIKGKFETLFPVTIGTGINVQLINFCYISLLIVALGRVTFDIFLNELHLQNSIDKAKPSST